MAQRLSKTAPANLGQVDLAVLEGPHRKFARECFTERLAPQPAGRLQAAGRRQHQAVSERPGKCARSVVDSRTGPLDCRALEGHGLWLHGHVHLEPSQRAVERRTGRRPAVNVQLQHVLAGEGSRPWKVEHEPAVDRHTAAWRNQLPDPRPPRRRQHSASGPFLAVATAAWCRAPQQRPARRRCIRAAQPEHCDRGHPGRRALCQDGSCYFCRAMNL